MKQEFPVRYLILVHDTPTKLTISTSELRLYTVDIVSYIRYIREERKPVIRIVILTHATETNH